MLVGIDAVAAPQAHERWRSLGPVDVAGSANAIAIAPGPRGDIYVGARGGGIWRSRDDGYSWEPLGDDLPTLTLSAIGFARDDPKTILVGTGDAAIGNDWLHGVGILRSTDRGKSWGPTSVAMDSYSVRNGYHAIEVNAVTGVVLAAGVTALLRSTDDGATWTEVAPPGNWTDVKWRPGSADSAYAVLERGGVHLSVDGGLTFRHLDGGLPVDSTIVAQSRLAVSASDPSCVYACFASRDWRSPDRLFRSTDGGATWSLRAGRLGLYLSDTHHAALAVNPRDPDDVIAGGFGLYRSRDGGISWTRAETAPFDCAAIVHRPGSDREVWLASDAGVFVSTDGGDTWTHRDRGLVTLELYHVCSAAGTRSLAYAGSQYHGLLRYSGGPEWEPVAGEGGPGGPAIGCNCDPRDPQHVYGVLWGGYHFLSRDGLRTYTWIVDGLYGNGRDITPVDMDRTDPGRLFTATDAGIFRTVSGGALWSRVGDGNDIAAISISPVTGRWVWALERSTGLVRRSTDSGTTWAAFQAAPYEGIGGAAILADPHDTLASFCTFIRHPQHPPLVLRTLDGGATWQDVTANLQGHSVHAIEVDPSRPGEWYVGTEAGVWCTLDAGVSWFRCGRGLPNAAVLDVEILDEARVLRAATDGRGLWEVDLPRRRAVARDVGGGLQLVTTATRRGAVSFRYSGSGGGDLCLRVYDVQGRLVSQVAATAADRVVRVATWDPRDAAAGVYFAALHAGETRLVRKVVVAR
jgi:photosystem II stability/assembly factor-like uncharacterized protein